MANATLLLVFLLGTGGLASGNFRCPPGPALGPYCTCNEDHSFSKVHCSRLDSLNTLKALKHRFGGCPIPWLEITDSQVTKVNANAFMNVSFERLVINSSRLESLDPEAFGGVTESLHYLDLEIGKLAQVPTPALSKLSKLKTLIVSDSALNSISGQDFAWCSGLSHLILSWNKISRVDADTFPRDLRNLALSGNKLTTLNNSVVHLPHLEWLLLAGNRLTEVRNQLIGLPRLRVLILSGNLLGDLDDDSFLDPKGLTALNLAFNGIRNLGTAFQPLVQLQILNLSNNQLSSLDGDGFLNLTKLTELDLSGNRLSSLGAAMEPLKGLRRLNLSHNQLVSLTHAELKWLKSIEKLDVSHNQLMVLDDLFGHDLAKMDSLILADNHLESLHGCLKHLRDLEKLDLRFNHLTSLDKHDIPSNGRLHLLRLEGNPWVCDGMLTHTLHDLDTRLISVEGRPLCGLPPPDGL